MKKIIYGLSVLFITLTACQNRAPVPTSEPDESEESEFEPIESEESDVIEDVILEPDTSTNYTFADSSNENGSMSYEIFVRSFYDTDGDGIGDLKGVEAKLPYLAELGIKTIWLMPIHDSPSYHGYDVKDYYSIHPDYGTLEDFDDLVETARSYNIDIMIDMVINHSSTGCQYIKDSYQDYIAGNTDEDSKADWYAWSRLSAPGYNRYRDVYVESRFSSSMPEFNFDSVGFKAELDNIFKFWIEDHGVKGFRLDAVLYYYYGSHLKNARVLTELEEMARKYDPDFYMVGECWQGVNIIQRYYTSTCDSFFAFQGSVSPSGETDYAIHNTAKGYLNGSTFTNKTEQYEAAIHSKNPNGYSSYFIANHDTDRASHFLTGDNSKVAASILTLLPGTPFMYYGEEIELKGVRLDGDNSDSRRRLPMIWSENDKDGECAFPEKGRQDLSKNDQVKLGVYDQLGINFSLLNHYKKLIHIRNKYPFMKHGIFTDMYDAFNINNRGIVAYKISLGDESVTIITNTRDYNVRVNVGSGLTIDESVNTSHQIPVIEDGYLKLGSKSTVVLK